MFPYSDADMYTEIILKDWFCECYIILLWIHDTILISFSIKNQLTFCKQNKTKLQNKDPIIQ